MGYVDGTYKDAAQKCYKGMVKDSIEADENGHVSLKGVCKVAGLGGTPYRDGSFEYYISEPIAINDYKGVGPFILAGIELELS